MSPPTLVAHRGYARHYPENTMPAIEAAVAAGASYVEVDVQLTRDGVPVLFHDRTLDRLCGVSGAVHAYAAAELSNLRASFFDRFGYKYAQVGIATLAALADFLARHPEVTAFVELKRIAVESHGAETLVRTVWETLRSVARQCVLISYSLAALAEARAQGVERIGVVVDKWKERRSSGVARLRPNYLFCDLDGLPRFGALRFAGAKVVVFEVDDAGVAVELARRGVDMIETFACGELARALEIVAGDTQ
jgi:glycerophosphoryl diester phosphodiesterase